MECALRRVRPGRSRRTTSHSVNPGKFRPFLCHDVWEVHPLGSTAMPRSYSFDPVTGGGHPGPTMAEWVRVEE
jgi:hypothetical protein